MNVVIFDTETTSLDKPFCYNIGYNIVDINSHNSILQKSFVVEQVWHNKMCFVSSYYAEKRPIYIKEMRAKKTKMEKFGYICQEMIRDFKNYNVEIAFAYNSSFDERVFNFNCDWFKCNNPFDTIEIRDIRGFVHNFIVDNDYIDFCERNEKFTESGNYSTTAETVKQYISNDISFEEEHTALSDSIIETEILLESLNRGANILQNYNTKKSIQRNVPKILKIKYNNDIIFMHDCMSYKVFRNKNMIVLK